METISLNNGWEFTEAFDEELLKKEYSGSLEKVRIPHTVKETPFHYFDEFIYQMVSGYRKWIHAEKSWEGKRVILRFHGVAHSAWVYLNGEPVGEHHCGYTSFDVELSEALRFGEDNLLTVKVDSRESQNIPPFGFVIDYMTYGGIYREVELLIKEELALEQVYVKPMIEEKELPGALRFGRRLSEVLEEYRAKARLCISFSMRCPKNKERFQDKRLYIDWALKDATGKTVCEKKTDVERQRDEKEEERDCLQHEVSLEEELEKIRLWDVVKPYLYTLTMKLCLEDQLLDEYQTSIGFRESVFREDGYYLNGRRLKIRGLNRHQSYPYVGYAMPASMQRMDADVLRFELGVNAVRTSHYPQSEHFIRRCDEIGLLVFTEIPGWQHIGDQEWKEQACQNVTDMIIQYRNHPSIILWGVRINESVDDDEFYARTNHIAHLLDDTRPTGGVRYLKKSHLLEDVYTYNDFVHEGSNQGCDPKRKVTSDMTKPYLISEYNGHMFPTKTFDSEEHRLEHALRHANVLNAVAKETDILGSFGWCMFDYNTHRDFGSGDRICYHGVLDMFRNPKLAAAVYAMQQKRIPVLEVSSSMDIGEHPAGNRGDVYIFTNADSVRMYKNDVLIKEYVREASNYPALKYGPIRIDDYVGNLLIEEEGFSAYQSKIIKEVLNYIAVHGMSHMPPQIKARMAEAMTRYHMKYEDAYALYQKYIGNWGGESAVFRFEAIRDGKVVKTVTKSVMTELQLEVKADHTVLKELDTYDVAAVRVRVTDQNGNVQPFYHQPLKMELTGPLELIGPEDLMIAGGMGGTYVKTTGESGKAELTIRLSDRPETENGKATISFEVQTM